MLQFCIVNHTQASNMAKRVYQVHLVFTDCERTMEALKQRWPFCQLSDQKCIVIAKNTQEIYDVCDELKPDEKDDQDVIEGPWIRLKECLVEFFVYPKEHKACFKERNDIISIRKHDFIF